MSAYQTLEKRAEIEYIVQKSRFLGLAAPVASAEEALRLLDDIKKEHRDANHHCFAYVIGQNKGVMRYSDDGEPSGTAGKPIIEVMTAKDVTNCMVVVTRYFGGTLLGAGGLARAYAHSAALALDAAGICAMYETVRWQWRIAYPQWDKVLHALQSLPAVIEHTDYAEQVTVTALCRAEDEAFVMEALKKTTDGKAETHREKETFYHPWKQ